MSIICVLLRFEKKLSLRLSAMLTTKHASRIIQSHLHTCLLAIKKINIGYGNDIDVLLRRHNCVCVYLG